MGWNYRSSQSKLVVIFQKNQSIIKIVLQIFITLDLCLVKVLISVKILDSFSKLGWNWTNFKKKQWKLTSLCFLKIVKKDETALHMNMSNSKSNFKIKESQN